MTSGAAPPTGRPAHLGRRFPILDAASSRDWSNVASSRLSPGGWPLRAKMLSRWRPARPAPPARALASPVQAAKLLAGAVLAGQGHMGRAERPRQGHQRPAAGHHRIRPGDRRSQVDRVGHPEGATGPVGVTVPVLGLVTALLGLGPALARGRAPAGSSAASGPGTSLTTSAGRLAAGRFGQAAQGQLQVARRPASPSAVGQKAPSTST